LDGKRRGDEAWAKMRNTAPVPGSGWLRVGLSLVPSRESGDVRNYSIDLGTPPDVVGPLDAIGATPRIVDFSSGSGKRIRAIVDCVGSPECAPVVLIPPAWGKTKETLLPLAATILATFANAGEPVVVIRFDGIRRRGESYNDPECLAVGCESLNYTFTQGTADILAVLDGLDDHPWDAQRVVLVTFSVAAIEGRRAIVADPRGRVAGWISAVGAIDPQSLVRQISGGVDYLGGAERGLKFGRQGVQGLLLDIDQAASDAINHRVAFLDDARRDVAGMDLPITWIRGEHDGWTDPARVDDVLSCGNVSKRQVVKVSTGHQLKQSKDAARVFRFISAESARMATGKRLPEVAPHASRLRERARAEVSRVIAGRVDLRSFWQDYLVGATPGAGMELVTHTSAYQGLMRDQIDALGRLQGQRVLDLGCGIGSFPVALLQSDHCPSTLRLVATDFVGAALARMQQRLALVGVPAGWGVSCLVSDLGAPDGTIGLPVAPASVDSVLASLVINYVQDPVALLKSIRDSLVPGGRIVLSGLKRDADTSRICVDGVTELRSGRGRAALGREGERTMEASLGEFINDAGRLLDLEERGWFSFWDAEELAEMAGRAGFSNVAVAPSFGTPSQAWLLSGNRPDTK
jgi:SAM-dependent methyltransferase